MSISLLALEGILKLVQKIYGLYRNISSFLKVPNILTIVLNIHGKYSASYEEIVLRTEKRKSRLDKDRERKREEEQPTKKLFLAIGKNKLSLSLSFLFPCETSREYRRNEGNLGPRHCFERYSHEMQTRKNFLPPSLSLSSHPLPFVHRGKTQRLYKRLSAIFISRKAVPCFFAIEK